MEKRKTKSLVAVANSKQESLFTISKRSVESEKFWRWGDDNLLPCALSLMSRRSTTH